MEQIENLTVIGVELWRVLLFTGILFVVILLGRLARLILRKISRRDIIQLNPVRATTVYALSRSVTFVFFTLGFLLGISLLREARELYQVLSTSADILIVIAIGAVLYYLIEVPTVWFEGKLEKAQKDMNKMFLPVIRKTLRGVLIVLVLIQIFQILSDKPITSIIAGLGIGGLAIALAAQDTIRHFFGSIVLVGDKPFDIGDRIVIDGHDGPVESVDLRSTRIRTLEGHLVTIPNGELANKTIQNIGKRPHIRRLSNITITYDTPPDKVREAKSILEDILKDHEGMDPEFPPRIYFSEFNADSLNLMMLYWYTPPDYWKYMEFSDRVNQEILERFNAAGIEFAFPTQTIHLKGEA
jgi:MscS family membrane protein